MADKLKITLVKSTIGAIPKHRATVELPNNAATKGMIAQVRHLVKVEEI